MSTPIENAISNELARLSRSEQELVLQFARSLQQDGAKGSDLLDLVGSISSEDLSLMQEAIETGCEQVDPEEW